jgi:AcrR family transcriptional regulator
VADAVLRVLAARGFAGLTMRAVGAELDASTGVITHYFATKRELVNFALDLLGQSVAERRRRVDEPGIPALRAAVLGMLPLTPETATANRIWISSWDVALSDPSLTANHAQLYAESRARLERTIRDAQDVGLLAQSEPARLAAEIHAFALGLTVQAVLDPDQFPSERVIAMTDTYLCSLDQRKGRPTCRGS